MGRMHVELAISYRPRAIVASDPIDARLAIVRNLFADRAAAAGVELHTINPRGSSLPQLIDRLTSSRGADDVIVAVGSAGAIEESQQLTGRGAVLNLFGGLKKGEDVVGFDTGIVHYKEINVTGSSGGSPFDVARTLELMAGGAIAPSTHITRIGDLEHAIDFLRMIRGHELDGKAVVYPHRRSRDILAVRSWDAQDEKKYLVDG
jgi:L-iditol 2-dehydrogenase